MMAILKYGKLVISNYFCLYSYCIGVFNKVIIGNPIYLSNIAVILINPVVKEQISQNSFSKFDFLKISRIFHIKKMEYCNQIKTLLNELE